MRSNGQAGRWPEVLPLLQLGYNLLLSDSDIGWFRSPLPYFAALRRAHPHADLLLCSDYVGNGYTTAPLPGGAEGDLDLDIMGNAKVSSINIGVLFAYAAANQSVATLIGAWADAVVEEGSGDLAKWDQGPINTKVLRPWMRPCQGTPSSAARTASSWASCRCCSSPPPSHTTSTPRRARVRRAAFSLHAIFSHGKSAERKAQILREAGLWTSTRPPTTRRAASCSSPHEDDAYRPTLSTEADGDADAAYAADVRAAASGAAEPSAGALLPGLAGSAAQPHARAAAAPLRRRADGTVLRLVPPCDDEGRQVERAQGGDAAVLPRLLG